MSRMPWKGLNRSFFLVQHQVEGECGTLAWNAFHSEGGVMQLQDLLTDIESQPSAFDTTLEVILGAVEAFEDVLYILG